MGQGVLTLEKVPLAAIANGMGTPVYVYSAGHIRQQYHRLARALNRLPHRICYSAKANGNLAILHLLHQLGAGVDIVSGGELVRAKAAGFCGADVVFSGVGKTVDEMDLALKHSVGMLNVESAEEMDVLAQVARRHGKAAPVAIRVNPEVTVDVHPYTATGMKGKKFGVPYDEAEALARKAARTDGLALRGLAMHIGSGITQAAPFVEALKKVLELYDALRRDRIGDIQSIDIGGGLGIKYRESDTPLDVDEWAAAIVPLLEPTGLSVIVEPGRFLVGNAGVLLSRVLYRKKSGGKMIAVIDAGMTDLIRPSHYQAYHDITVLGGDGRATVAYDVVGPICESGDFLALDRELPELNQGDLVVVHGAGAYGFVMTSTYNARPRPPEVLVDGPRWAVIRDRELPEDLMRHEWVEPDWREVS